MLRYNEYYVFIPLCHLSYHMLQSRFEDYAQSILYMVLVSHFVKATLLPAERNSSLSS